MKELWNKIVAWCKNEDWWYLAVIGLVLVALVIYWCLWGLLIICLGIIATVAIAETIFIKWWHMSVSDNFRQWRQNHPWQAKIILFLMALLMVALIYHFTRQPNI